MGRLKKYDKPAQITVSITIEERVSGKEKDTQ
jgi:hypothetical protein